MKNYVLALLLALLVVLTSMALRRSVFGGGGSHVPRASTTVAIGGSPVPLPPPGTAR